MKRVYLDNAATTPIAPEVVEAMIPILQNEFGNPSSTHFYGRQSKALLETSRRTVAAHLNCSPKEIIFTSGGTEADNMAILSSIENGVKRIITSPLEHHAILHTVEHFSETLGIKFEIVKLTENGHIDLVHLRELLANRELKTLVSLMHGNNEIGNLLPLEKVSALCREFDALFHSDTVQTMGHYAFDLEKLDIDFITCAAHKFHGPKGIGFLYVNKRNIVHPLIHGGAQERGFRGGTENMYGIVGLAKAMDLAYDDVQSHQEHVQSIKNQMISQLKTMFNDVSFHGDITPETSLYTVLNVCFPITSKGNMLLFTLDLKGVACSGGSACSSGSSLGSHVLQGIQCDMSRPNARFSFSRYTTKDEIDYALEQISEVYEINLVS
jgi:cysteine desulfurase